MIIGPRTRMHTARDSTSGAIVTTWSREINGKLFRFSRAILTDGRWASASIEATPGSLPHIIRGRA